MEITLLCRFRFWYGPLCIENNAFSCTYIYASNKNPYIHDTDVVKTSSSTIYSVIVVFRKYWLPLRKKKSYNLIVLEFDLRDKRRTRIFSLHLSLSISHSLSFYFPLSLSLSLFLFHFLSPSISPHYLSIYLPVYLSVYLSIYSSLNLSTYQPIYLSIYLSIHPSVYLSMYLFIIMIYVCIYTPIRL